MDTNNNKKSDKTTQLNCYYTNATSLNSEKLAELDLKVNLEKYHIIFITETGFTELLIASLSNYYLFRKDRLTWIRVCIYIRKDLNSTDVPDEKLNKILSGSTSEQLWKSVSLGKEKILIGCIYRPPLWTDHQNNVKIDNEIIKSLY